MDRRKFGLGLAGVVVLLLAVAWADGGRQDMRLIEQPLALPGAQPGQQFAVQP